MPGDYSEELVELGARVLVDLRYGADEHAPWSYTEFGALCNCGEAIIRDDMCAGRWDYMSAEVKDGYRMEARTLLAALSSAGRLVPEGSEVRARIAATADTLHVVAEWGFVPAEELHRVAQEVAAGDVADWTSCPVCEEIECDAGCPLEPIRLGYASSLAAPAVSEEEQ